MFESFFKRAVAAWERRVWRLGTRAGWFPKGGWEVRCTLGAVTLNSEHSTVCGAVSYGGIKPEGGYEGGRN